MAHNKRLDPSRVITWLLLLFILAVLSNIWTLVKDRDQVYKVLEDNVVARVLGTVKDGEHGDTPVKGVDYQDGKDGIDGIDGKDGRDGRDGDKGMAGYTPIKGIDYSDGTNGKDGKDGLDGEKAPIYMQRCNVEKNRWEYKYETDLSWSIVPSENDEPVKCTSKRYL